MSAEVYIELPATSGAPLRLARLRGGELEEASPTGLAPGSRTKAVAFAPALAVSRFRIPLPARNESEARKAALFALEDDLAQPVEEIAITLGPRPAAGAPRDVYVVDRALLTSWLTALDALGLSGCPIVPEASLPPAGAHVYRFEDRLLLAAADRTFGADASLPDDILRTLIDAAGLTHAPVTHAAALATLAQLHTAQAGITLDGPDGTPARRPGTHGARAWFTAAALALAVCVLWISTVWLDTRNLAAAAGAQDAAARQRFHALYPAAPDPADLHAEIRRQAQRAEAAPRTRFQPLAAAVYAALAGSDTIRLSRLSWSASDAALRADLHFAGRADEAAFHARLQAAGWASETAAATDTALGVDATVTVRAQP
jgi:general secretion pathway protein L